MTIGFDPNILLSYYQARAGVAVTGLDTSTGTVAKRVAPTAPWSGAQDASALSASVKNAMLGRKLVDENAAQLDLTGASTDYKKLFALYNGLNTLSGVADQINGKGLTSVDKAKIQQVFAKGLSEVSGYVDDLKLDQLRLTDGDVALQARTKLGVAKPKTDYVTAPLVSGSTTGEVPAFQGDVKFNMAVKRTGSPTTNVALDLGEMGATPRTFGNVINYINQKLADAGTFSRVASQRIPGAARSIQVNGKAVALPPGPDQWALRIKIDSSETVSFSAPTTAPSVYVAQTVGDPDPDKKASTDDGVTPSQLLKFQTDTTSVPGPLQPAGEANWVDGRVFAETLGPEVKTVHATQVGPDGSVYMLADVDAKTSGQDIKGDSDVALLKYNSAGNFLYARTLGAADDASGLGLAVSADGKVAIAGAVTGVLNGATDGALNSGATGAFAGKSDSFVTVFNAAGEELWTQRRGAREEDEASQLTFGADGTVYVAGRSKSVMAGTTSIGGYDGYIEAFKADATGKVQTKFTQSYGTTGNDAPKGMVLDGTNLVTASVEDGHAVLRRFDISSGSPVLSSTRDLGDLQGGDIAGLALDGGQVVVAGTTRNATLSAGSITRAHAGGSDAFVARISADLSVSGSDKLAYYGGTGDDTATSLAVSGGKVFLGGSAGTDLPGQAPVGTKDGYLTEIDVANGAIDWSRRFTGKDGRATPTAIAVDTQGSSVLDRLGLPKGQVSPNSSQITAISSIRAGDQFTVKVGDGRAAAVTIEAKDTLDTLAQKIRRASGFMATVDIVTSNGVRYINIKPLNDRTVVELGAGKTDKDALAALGLQEGVLRATKVVDGQTVSADGKGSIYGLGLPKNLNLDDAEQVRHSAAEIAAAMGVIRTAYKDLVTAASPKTAATTAAAAASGPVPAYLTNQIANYQAALSRLTGG